MLRISGLGACLSLALTLYSRVAAAQAPVPAAPEALEQAERAEAVPAAAAEPGESPETPPATPGGEDVEEDVEEDVAEDVAAPESPEAPETGLQAPSSAPPAPEPPPASASAAPDKLVYLLERIEIVGNRTSRSVIRRFVPLRRGDRLDVDDPALELARWRLMGTGYFNDVRLSLARGTRRGWVVLVIEVEERNTLVISSVVAGLARVVTSSRNRDDTLRPYGGLGVSESNLLGLGIGVAASAVVSRDQFGLDLRYRNTAAVGSGYDITGRAFYNDAREFFGREPQVEIHCPPPDPDDEEPCDQDVVSERAVVIYDRAGVGVGSGHEITTNLRYELDWLGELVDVHVKPRVASSLVGDVGGQYSPIDFRINDGLSYVSSLHLGMTLDLRDDPTVPTHGHLLQVDGRVGSGLLGSSYNFVRLELRARQWFALPLGHVLSVGAMAGTVVGRAPFFYHFYAADLSDLLPSRVLELNLDHRRTHNLLNTAIQEFDKQNVAARLDFEYQLPLFRGGGGLRGLDAYAGAGLFALASHDWPSKNLPGYSGLERLPVDLTFDIGVRGDTAIGLFKVGFSSLIGFLPDLGQQP
ncbi:MAG: BamA/TamA family outer membrane protein [Myxococcales bacterium]|nr:BamA/TamA family outer membrane protein [Myxococcales bacterium]